MKTYRIVQTSSGVDLGEYQGETPEGAIRAMLADAGCTEEPDPGLIATPMHEPEIREAIRQAIADFDSATPEQRENEKRRLVALYGADKPSAGPWEAHDDDGTGTLPCVLSEHVNPSGTFYVGQFNRYADAVLCAAAPDLAEKLLALAAAAAERENTMGDPCRLLECRANLEAATRAALETLRKVGGLSAGGAR